MFNPSREQVRIFFTTVLKKHHQNDILTPIENQALNWVLKHPEYHEDLLNPDNQHKDYQVENGQTNPFLHLSMHLAIQEQINIDSPPGIKAIAQKLIQRYGEHEAHHKIMEALGLVIWEAQRHGAPMNNERYLELLEKLV
ncbi:DUF1841 family protein [Basilea psittacipulmonis]|uniref:DUF1841 domain-containing protein n=1 Tax=Basilea psittacipulmonis DSM 24701 TaxID=1072685 RepID=A0A077DG53_9BURK|nr:DUF1841 family protein [Basilea psittacipulmonis]AIL33156.1 hypothetical protein IX83_07485 [Basilea psittacipulmonis DSM 24701]